MWRSLMVAPLAFGVFRIMIDRSNGVWMTRLRLGRTAVMTLCTGLACGCLTLVLRTLERLNVLLVLSLSRSLLLKVATWLRRKLNSCCRVIFTGLAWSFWQNGSDMGVC